MKIKAIFPLFFALMPLLTAMPQKKTLLECLGQEEEYIHQHKVKGPHYKLNQTLVNKWDAFPLVQISPKLLDQICSSKQVSLELIKVMLTKKKGTFRFKGQTTLGRGQFDDFWEEVPSLFMSYLSSLQGTLVRGVVCFETYLPEYGALQKNIKYLQSEMSLRSLFQEKSAQKQLKMIFQRLANWEALVKKCQ